MINRSFASGETKSKQHSKHLLQVKSIKSMTKEYKDFELKGFQKNIILGLLGIPETTQKVLESFNNLILGNCPKIHQSSNSEIFKKEVMYIIYI